MSLPHPEQNVGFHYGTTHHIKTWPTYFNQVINGIKKFEVRKNDRKYTKGDVLILEEWNPNDKAYTGAKCSRRVNFILEGGQFGIEPGYVVMGIEPF